MNQNRLTHICFLTLLSPLCVSASTIILDSGSFSASNQNANGGSLGTVETASFSLTTSQISSTTFEANFSTIDAGIIIRVNGVNLFDTGNDVSQFRVPSAFNPTINNPFDPNGNVNGIPRLTVNSSASGTSFSGSPNLNSTSSVTYTPSFSVANFTSLLQPGANTIEIINSNGFQGAALIGDFHVCTIPEPTTITLAGAGFLALISRRKRLSSERV